MSDTTFGSGMWCRRCQKMTPHDTRQQPPRCLWCKARYREPELDEEHDLPLFEGREMKAAADGH